MLPRPKTPTHHLIAIVSRFRTISDAGRSRLRPAVGSNAPGSSLGHSSAPGRRTEDLEMKFLELADRCICILRWQAMRKLARRLLDLLAVKLGLPLRYSTYGERSKRRTTGQVRLGPRHFVAIAPSTLKL